MTNVAVVTGAASGIGAATAKLLVEDGYDVVGLDRSLAAIDGVTFYPFDVTDVDNHDTILDTIEHAHGPIEAFANAAGAYFYTTMREVSLEDFRAQLAVFLEGAVFLSRAVGLRMLERGRGRIVNVTSTASTASMANSFAYNTAKGGLDAGTRALALELAPHNVLINLVAPGFVRTPMSNDPSSGQNEADSDWFTTGFVDSGRLPIGRTSEPVEIAGPIVFLLSERNTYISGETLVVDGGMLASI
ncbi:SDR family NAD(P)-dependent oxidoreductase [Amycolatopsis sp. TRM77291]